MTVEKGPIVELLRSQFKSLEFLASSLGPQEWHSSASLPGWAVIDVFAHIIGTESMLEGHELPDSKTDVAAFEHVHNKLGMINETWIESLSLLEPPEMLDRFKRIAASRMRSLDAMTQQEFEAQTDTPIGPRPYWRFMQIRVFDCWMHEQDIREGLRRPGHESGPCARAAVDEAQRAMGYIVADVAKATEGQSVTIELTGPVKRAIHVLMGDGPKVVEELTAPASATIAMSSSLFMRLIGGRAATLTARLGDIEFEGDLDLAQRVVTNLAFTP
jgi:uncharacterized protein (TIGR03083 family)